jgi:hypothetical protein
MGDKTSTLPTFLHWFSWTLSGAASLFFLFFLIGEGIPDILRGAAKELLFFLPFLLMAIAGCFISFFKQKFGAILMLIGGIGTASVLYFQGGSANFGVMVVYGLPYIFPGGVFLFVKR